MESCFSAKDAQAIPIEVVVADDFNRWLKQLPANEQQWIKSVAFAGKPESFCLIPSASGKINRVIYIVKRLADCWNFAILSRLLPKAVYRLPKLTLEQASQACLAWGVAQYEFTRYKSNASAKMPQLVWPKAVDYAPVEHMLASINLVRDLINTPAEDMGPEQLAKVAIKLAKQHKAQCKQIVGDELLTKNYPAIYTVGRASNRKPRLIELTWGNKKHPRVSLVGKGVCFDTGGLNIKVGNGMGLMKKDMGGAAHVLGLASLIMRHRLPVYLQVLIPAVDNAIAGNAYRPGDVVQTRKGLTIEITNTDAEGRVILADALTAACEHRPELLIDMATLTGAARIALGTDIPICFTRDESVAAALNQASDSVADPLWRLPLYAPYRKFLESTIADLNNSPNTPYAGAITAALFVHEFIPEAIPAVHFDLMAWNIRALPGRPEGGEAQALRALWRFMQTRFC